MAPAPPRIAGAACISQPPQAGCARAASVFASDMSSWMLFQGLALLTAVAGLAWYFVDRQHRLIVKVRADTAVVLRRGLC